VNPRSSASGGRAETSRIVLPSNRTAIAPSDTLYSCHNRGAILPSSIPTILGPRTMRAEDESYRSVTFWMEPFALLNTRGGSFTLCQQW
jgi:hypothetical protein